MARFCACKPSPIAIALAAAAAFHLCHIANAQYLLEVLEYTPFETQRAVLRCEATGASFGQSILDFNSGTQTYGCAIWAEPRDACGNVTLNQLKNDSACDLYFAVASRGNCNFSEKAYNVQNALPLPFHALIVANDAGKPPIAMSGAAMAENVTIPSVMISFGCSRSILSQYSASNGYSVTIKLAPGYGDLIKYLVPFVVIVLFCFIILCISLLIRLCRERRRLARKRLSRANLRKIPVKKYKKRDDVETCAICLEDFVENDKVRELPCRHTYHQRCIDPWLLKNRKVCPIDRRKVGPSTGSDSSDSEGERSPTLPSIIASRDSAPLIRNAQPMPLAGDDATAAANHAHSLNIDWLLRHNQLNYAEQPSTSTSAYPYPTPNAVAPAIGAADADESDDTAQQQRPISRLRRGIGALARRFRERVSNAQSSLHRLRNEDASAVGSDIERLVDSTGAENSAFETVSTSSTNNLLPALLEANIHVPVIAETDEPSHTISNNQN